MENDIKEFSSEEIILDDNDEVIYGFYYICDGEIKLNQYYSILVKNFKSIYNCSYVRRCDIFKRNLV